MAFKTTPEDFDPFEDDAFAGYDKDKDKETYKPETVKPADFMNNVFTVTDITRQDTPQSDYHYFQWIVSIETPEGYEFNVKLNPSKNRNKFLTDLMQDLPVKDMTFKQKQFTEQRSLKLITYYELEHFTHEAQVTTKSGKRKKSA